MDRTLLLYFDFLGFSELVRQPGRVEELYDIVDKAAFHRDSNCRAVVFSDTVVVYNVHKNLQGSSKAIELMFLIELAQELFLRLAGAKVFFRAVIKEGDFTHKKLTKMEAFYGLALVEACRAEKGLCGIGLFLDRELRQWNQVFRWRQFSGELDFIYLTHHTTALCWVPGSECAVGIERSGLTFPIPSELVEPIDMHFLVYPEIVHFREVYGEMNDHPLPEVRAKFLALWNMYCLAYPSLMRSLVDHKFDACSVAQLDWTKPRAQFFENRPHLDAKTVD